MRFFVIGDIHGMYDKFLSVMEQINLQKEDYIVFLGDYGDRGKDSLKVIKYVYNLQKKFPNVYALRGNHEENFLLLLNEVPLHSKRAHQLVNSGKVKNTEYADFYHNYYDNACETIELMRWVNELPYHLELCNIHFSHAGCNPLNKEQTNDDYIWTRGEFLRHYNDKKLWFCGHTPIQIAHDYIGGDPIVDAMPVYLDNNVIMMDTGSFLTDGKISCLDIINGELFQSTIVEGAEGF